MPTSLVKITYRLVICLAALLASHAAFADNLKVGMLIPGRIDDGGFMEAGYDGLMRIKKDLNIETSYIDNIKPEIGLLSDALRKLAADGPDLIIAHGGQNGKAVEAVAPEFPNIKFAVVQGNTKGKNVSSYEVLQEQSAWLAGAAAGLLTKTNVVGHISGIRVPPGLKGRAAFYHGLMNTNPGARFLTVFAGDQDDVELARRVAAAEIDAGADIIFTMLNAGRAGSIEAMRERGVRQIGNVRDWYSDHPDVFVASAIANVSLAAFHAAKDLADGDWKSGEIIKIGLEDPEAVSLALSPGVSDEVKAGIAGLSKKIVAGEIEVLTDYDGAEFKF
ncbi:BMP family protein [Phyllobacterium sp. 21LDTY02-6]|uniref:BMP family protein n=1 Tax=Phyllobacterium sp. 21LDTY02-6 TaxID=2944903 RepID=UPI0020215A69|nr:BMP family protein [Phyllobacterium sp. 21LDTY02-6]MCO4317899.1 BMP family protein [Phyllobacterium sp. 21LDTY02-6]